MVVRMRRNRSQTAKRRSHHAIDGARLSKDASGGLHQRHRVNLETGMYRGRVVIDVVAKAQRDARRKKRHEKELMASGQAPKSEPSETAPAT